MGRCQTHATASSIHRVSAWFLLSFFTSFALTLPLIIVVYLPQVHIFLLHDTLCSIQVISTLSHTSGEHQGSHSSRQDNNFLTFLDDASSLCLVSWYGWRNSVAGNKNTLRQRMRFLFSSHGFLLRHIKNVNLLMCRCSKDWIGSVALYCWPCSVSC